MKKAYSFALDAVLKTEIPKQLPGFAPISPKIPKSDRSIANIGKTEAVFEKHAELISMYFVFSRHPRQEEFNLNLAWSTRHTYPHALERPSTKILDDGKEVELDEAIVGFYELYPRVTGVSHLGWAVWKCSVDFDHPLYRQIFVLEDMAPVSPEDALVGAKVAVDKCVQDIKTVAMPYFERVVRAHLPA